jgi:uncharacterized protein (DUF1810 family)
MTDEELREFVGRHVELKLASGMTLVGRLVAGADAAPAGTRYAVQSLHESSAEASEDVYAPVRDAEAVEWIRILQAPIGEDRFED